MIQLTDALISLYPTASFVLHNENYVTLEWYSVGIPKPTEKELTDELRRLQAEYDAKEYQRLRASEYPSIGDQLDALWKGGEAAAAMLEQVQAVKAKYPKE